MTQKEIIEIFEELDLSSIRTNFEIAHSHFFDENFMIEQPINKYWIDINFNVNGRNSGEGFFLKDVTIIDAILWKDEGKQAVITDNSLVKIEKLLIKMIKEL